MCTKITKFLHAIMSKKSDRFHIADNDKEVRDMLEDMYPHFGTKHWGTTTKIIVRKAHQQNCPWRYQIKKIHNMVKETLVKHLPQKEAARIAIEVATSSTPTNWSNLNAMRFSIHGFISGYPTLEGQAEIIASECMDQVVSQLLYFNYKDSQETT